MAGHHGPYSAWQPDEVDEAERLWYKGIYAVEIAEQLNINRRFQVGGPPWCTKNMVIGQARRNGWKRRTVGDPLELPPRPARPERVKIQSPLQTPDTPFIAKPTRGQLMGISGRRGRSE